MKYVPYVLKHLRRNWIRTLSTVLALMVCIFLFCTLQTVLEAVNWGLRSANASRIVTRHAVSLVFNVPLSYEGQIRQLPGVKNVAISSWFGGSLPAKKEEQEKAAAEGEAAAPDFSNFFPNFAVEAEPYLAIYPEFQVPDDQKRAFLEDRRGAVIGRGLAKRYGWKVGDSFFLESFIPPYRRRDGPFEFVVQAIYDVDKVRNPGTQDDLMLFHFKYLEEATGRRVAAGTYVIEVADPSRAGSIAKAVDELFENSEVQTRTETEAAFLAGFVSMAGNLALLLNTIGLAVIFTILLVTANTMSMAVRERRTEIAVLKTLGFSSAVVMALILAEALVLGITGGGLGLILSRVAVGGLKEVPMIGDALRQYPSVGLTPRVGALGFGMAVFIGLAAGFVPALMAYRARITEMLRQV